MSRHGPPRVLPRVGFASLHKRALEAGTEAWEPYFGSALLGLGRALTLEYEIQKTGARSVAIASPVAVAFLCYTLPLLS